MGLESSPTEKRFQLFSWKGLCRASFCRESLTESFSSLVKMDIFIPISAWYPTIACTTHAAVVDLGCGSWNWPVYCVSTSTRIQRSPN